jgi:threonine/homoserine/homoserine lactone efflux protein
VNALGVLHAAGLGLGLGVVTSMSPAVINVSIVDAATAGRRRFATGLGIGGATADVIHAGLAFAGVGSVVIANPRLVRGLAIVAAAAIVGYAVVIWRRRAAGGEARDRAGPREPDERGAAAQGGDAAGRAGDAEGGTLRARLGRVSRGAATGFALTLVNPAALAAWVAVAAAAWRDAALAEAAVIAGGVGAGSALWFTLLARWIGRVRRDHPVLAAVPRVSLILLIAIALVGVIRAL